MRQIGKYQVLEQIGVGGFGEVYKGFDPYIKRHVAIKTCSSRSEEIRSRFFQEAEISGNLNHKNVTTIYDFGIEGALPYLVQEYLSGEDLDKKIKRADALPYAEKLFYLIQVARGLAHAHENGVIHRDIKPANVRVLEDGTTKIMDFGIAKLAQQETGLTETGMTLGTAAYLSPEQIRGEPVDPRTDIFSFGVLAYELLAYRRPFTGTQISAVLYQLLHHEPTPMAEACPEAPAEMAAVIERCLQKTPEKRFPNANDLLHALENLHRPSPAPAPAPPPKKPAVTTKLRNLAGRSSAGGRAETQQAQQSQQTQQSQQGQRSTTTVANLDEIEISTALVAAPPLDSTGTEKPSESRGSIAWLFAVLLLAAAGAGGWWFGTRQPGGSSPASGTEGASGVSGAGQVTEDVTSPGPNGTSKTSTDDGGKAKGGGSEGEDGSPTASAPAKLDPGILVVARPPWTDRMTVKIGGGAARVLDRARQFSLAPGSYRLIFEVDEGGYRAARTIAVTLGEGERENVSVPIPEPGGLSVRPQLNRPQGEVLIDGLPHGPSPLRQRLLAPGSYRVEVRPRGGGDSLEKLAEIRPGQLLILTFDLEAGMMQQTEKPLDRR